MSQGLFQKQHKTLNIKSLKELEPRDWPRWFKICFWVIFSGFPFLMLFWIGDLVGILLLQWVGILGFFIAFPTVFVVVFVPFVIRILGYWWPWLGLKSAQIDPWLQRDLDLGD